MHDAVVVGAGPNGLAASIELARNRLSVLLVEANDTIGGSARTEERTLPGFKHDVGSAVYPLGVASPFFSSLPLEEHGLEWVHPDAPLAHPLDGGRAVMLERSLDGTVSAFERDRARYERYIGPFVRMWPSFVDHSLDAPLRLPKDPVLMARFGLRAMLPATKTAATFRTEEARALLAGNVAHSGTPVGARLAGAVGVSLMAAGHAVGWPVPRGGAGSLTQALGAYFESLGGTIETGRPVTSVDDLPESRATLLALTYGQVAKLAGHRLPPAYKNRLQAWKYGPGAFKLDWALDAPIPWSAPDTARAATVHVGGGYDEIVESEMAAWVGEAPDRPFVLLAQPSLFDPTRAPAGKHTAWAYCHVPNAWDGDATEVIERQIERFAPGFRDRILARSVMRPRQLESWNANVVGGDVNGGALTMAQLLGPLRWTLRPWSTPVSGLYVCSASTPPGGGVHGMCGYHAAREALRRTFGIR